MRSPCCMHLCMRPNFFIFCAVLVVSKESKCSSSQNFLFGLVSKLSFKRLYGQNHPLKWLALLKIGKKEYIVTC
jgi:hypothetical protein